MTSMCGGGPPTGPTTSTPARNGGGHSFGPCMQRGLAEYAWLGPLRQTKSTIAHAFAKRFSRVTQTRYVSLQRERHSSVVIGTPPSSIHSNLVDRLRGKARELYRY